MNDREDQLMLESEAVHEASAPAAIDGVEPKPMPDAAAEREDVSGDTPVVAENYAYWRAHGGIWADEYAARKRRQPYFHLQELMIADYALRTAERLGSGTNGKPNLRVLELGCGPGRHLRNLSRLPGIDVFGYDQSRTMVSGMLNWTGQAWIDEHVTIGLPTGKLPFADGSFDLVYTSEVLVHVRPEDLEERLSELVRVSRGQVLHIEPSDAAQICREAHDGCWKHDLVAAYEHMGIEAELLPAGYRLQRPTRVVIDEALVPYTWPAHILDMYRSFEQDMEGTIEGTIDELAAARASVARVTDEMAKQKTRADEVLAAQIAIHAAMQTQSEAMLQHERAERAAAAQASAHAIAQAAEQTRLLAARVHELEMNLQLRERMMSAKASELAASVLEVASLRGRLGEATQSAQQLTRELGEARASHTRLQESSAAALLEAEHKQRTLCEQIAALEAEVAALRAEREADQQTFRARSAELELEAMRQKLATDYYKGIKERFVAAAAPVIGL